MEDFRDLEAAMVRHAERFMNSSEAAFGTDQLVTFGGIRSDWKRAPKSGVVETTAAHGADYIHFAV